jgi:hypothetical protein
MACDKRFIIRDRIWDYLALETTLQPNTQSLVLTGDPLKTKLV